MPGQDRPALVSIIIPTYNRAQLLRLTVESVLAQTYPALEIIVVDDGSTDDTPAVMAQYAGRVIYLRQANQGEAAARNRGIRTASGEYLTFLDHDDLFLPTKIERQVEVMDARPKVGLVHCGYYHIDENGDRLEKVVFLPERDILKELVHVCFIWQGGPLVRRQCLERVGLFEEGNWSADWDMWLRIALAGFEFACIQEPLGAYRIIPGSMMARIDKLEEASFQILDKIFADPRLPANVHLVKKQAYGNTHLWLSWRYYGAGRWDDAQRNLTQAVACIPRLLEQPEGLLDSLCGDALSVRVNNPVKFVSDVLNHLPPGAAVLCQYRAYLLARVHLGLALRLYGTGKMEQAGAEIEAAIALDPLLLEHTDDFARLLCRFAMKLPVRAPGRYVEEVLQNLPPGAQRLTRVQAQVLSGVHVATAFEDYYAGRRRAVIPRVLRAIRQRPSSLANRGVLSIFLRSLPALLARERVIA
jgi:glycosyltransferase involved in cell wall biosynthesis